MVNVKSFILLQSLLLMSRSGVFAQSLTPNASLFIPSPTDDGEASFGPGEVIIASQVSVTGATTIFELVDSDPTATATTTFTLGVSPSGVSVHLAPGTSNITAGGGMVQIDGTEDIDCSTDDKSANCTLEIVVVGQNSQMTLTSTSLSTFTAPVSSVPVVALNFQQTASPTTTGPSATGSTTGSSSSSSSGSSTNSPTPTNSAAAGQASFGFIALVALGLALRLM